MSTFGLTPANEAGNVPEAPQNFPRPLQIRFNGVDLGGPDATVLDFVGAFALTYDDGVITVELS